MDTPLNLAHNENLYGPAPGCLDVLRRASPTDLSCYAPNFAAGTPSPLLTALAEHCQTPASSLVLGYGAEDILKAALSHLLAPGDTLLAPSTSWPYYQVLADATGAKTATYPVLDHPDLGTFSVDADALADHPDRAHARVVLLANPNNPTGNPFPLGRLPEILDAYPHATVIVDEAYLGLGSDAPDPAALPRLAAAHPNLLIIRTFSKLYGLAGARIGYAIAGAGLTGLTAQLARYLGYHRISEKLALAALADPDHYARVRTAIAGDRTRIATGLGACGHQVYRSDANFVLVRFADPATARHALTRAGITVKWLTGDLTGCARITIGTHAHTDALLTALGAGMQTAPARTAPSIARDWEGVGHSRAAGAYLFSLAAH